MPEKTQTALLIGNTDGIGLELTKRLLAKGYQVTGISRSASNLAHTNYTHSVQDVADSQYKQHLQEILQGLASLDLCVFCAGIGNAINLDDLAFETKVFEVNLMAAVITTELVLFKMRQQKHGHFIGLSSIADAMVSALSPSYNASKSGISSYWEGLALALAREKVHVTNVRFGFVDTKMAKANFKPFLLSVKQAANFLEKIIANPRVRATKPLVMDCIIGVLGLVTRLKTMFG